ncbi:hypothetical protein D039_4095A, partial [Vibrio parahaemolyticus EKP-028]
MYWQGE